MKVAAAYREDLAASQGKQSAVLERLRLKKYADEGARQAADVAQVSGRNQYMP